MRLAWPLMVSTGSHTVMQFVDRMFLSWHSPVSIQAALPAGVFAFTLVSLFMAVCSYTSTFVAQYHGAGEPEGCSRSAIQGVWLALASWPLILLLIPVGRWLLGHGGHPPEVLAEELQYFTILMLGGVGIPLGAAAGSFFTGRGDTRTNMIAQVVANVVNLVLAYLFILGRGGFPEMGIAGAGLATVIAGFVAPAMLLGKYFARRFAESHGTRRFWRFEPHLCARIVRFALPSGIHLAMDVASFTVFVFLTGRLGGLALTVSNIAFSINLVAFMPLIGMSIAATIIVGQYQGRGDPVTAERAAWNCLRLGAAYMAIVGLTYVLFPAAYFGLFTNHAHGGYSHAEILKVGRWLLVLLAAWGIPDAANLVLAGALKGAGDTRFVMTYQLLMSWLLLVPVQALLIFRFGQGIFACWVWLTIYVVILAAGFILRFVSGRWKNIQVIEHLVIDRPQEHVPAAQS
jgi:MATE family multidrug resistance protein